MSEDKGSRNFLRTIAPGVDPNVDIVAVHGLNPKNKPNHAEMTWTHTNNKLWLRDFLPLQLPRARIQLFSYNSNVGIQSSSAGVREQVENLLRNLLLERENQNARPIIFIAHSLGGIIVKEALVQAKLRDKYISLYNSTYGIAFFGTPHRGCPLAGIGDIIVKVVGALLKNPSNTYMRALKKDDLYSSELHDNFQQLVENFKYLNFYETLPLRNLGLFRLSTNVQQPSTFPVIERRPLP